MTQPVVMSWSGGKDSAIALHEMLRAGAFEVVALLTSMSEEHRRISHHGVRETLLRQQAEALGLPLDMVLLPSRPDQPCTNDVYERAMAEALLRYRARGVTTVAFGDLFLEDLRAYREQLLHRLDMRAAFPLWKRDTAVLASEVIDRGFKSYLSCVEGKVGPGFAGRRYDRALLESLPARVDPCGEYGEFHTFVYDGPIFSQPVDVRVGDVLMRDGRYYADLLPSAADVTEPVAMPPV